MRNWKTTTAALIINVIYAILTAMQIGGINVRDIAIMAGLQAIGTLAKDFNVSEK